MSRRRTLALATALAAVAAASSAAPATGSARTDDATGQIVFVSARANVDPGEIYALAAGKAPRPIFHSPYAEVALATAPKGRALAFWSDRSGPWRVMISPDGTRLRSVAIAGAGATDGSPWPPVFSPDGTQVVIPYLPHDAIAQVPALAIAGVAAGPAVPLSALCDAPPVWSPNSRQIACESADQKHVIVSDLNGHVSLTVPGQNVLWSASGRLAVTQKARTVVMTGAGRVVARIAGAARAWSPDGSTLALTRSDALALVRPGHSARARIVPTAGATLYWVAFTPDSRDVVYAGGVSGTAETAAVSGGKPRPFAAASAGTWSRDGRYATTVGSSALRVELTDASGHTRSVSGPMPYDGRGASVLAWTGDGSRLLYDTSFAGRPELWAMRANGAAQHRLTGAIGPLSEPAWSADGTKIAYSSAGGSGNGGIVIARADGTRLAAIRGSDSDDGSPSWSPNGKALVVANDAAGGASVVNVATGARTDVAVDGAAPAWSPDGATIAFVGLDDGTVWGSTPNGADRHRLLPATVRGVRSLAWSPDGKQLAFTTAKGVFIAAANARTPGRLIVAARLPGPPAFSPDGRQIAFAATVGATHPYRAIFAVGTDGSGRRQLTTGPYDSGDPAWRPALSRRP
jgi:Tol biopolymer transport system component